MASARKTTRDASAEIALLEELKTVAEKLGLSVREERLLREVGYHVRSGTCRVGEEEVVFLDRSLPTGAQIDVLVEELAGRSLDAIYLSPAARALLERAAEKRERIDPGETALGG